jgi:hypothetical protein
MRSAGIKQLKARLSEYVRLARSGEHALGLPSVTVVELLDDLRGDSR